MAQLSTIAANQRNLAVPVQFIGTGQTLPIPKLITEVNVQYINRETGLGRVNKCVPTKAHEQNPIHTCRPDGYIAPKPLFSAKTCNKTYRQSCPKACLET